MSLPFSIPLYFITMNLVTSGTVVEVEEVLAAEVEDMEEVTPEVEDGVATAPAATPSVPGRAGSRVRTRWTPSPSSWAP